MITRQITVAFDEPQDMRVLVEILKRMYPSKQVTIGMGFAVNGIHENWIVVHDDA